MSGWSMWLMRMRLAMNSHRRRKVAEGGGGRPLGPGVALGGPAGNRPCWDPFWHGRVAAAANPAPGLAVPTQPPIHG